jgi:hypothetical protein
MVYLENKVSFRLHLGFNRSEFPEAKCIRNSHACATNDVARVEFDESARYLYWDN